MTRPRSDPAETDAGFPYRDLPRHLARLDARDTGYQFDLETDIGWDRIDEPGLFVPDDFVRDLGVDPDALRTHPEAWEMFQWAAALQIAEGFIYAEQELVGGLHLDRTKGLLAHRSNQLLHDEELKHIALFKRLANRLRDRQPMWSFDFDRHSEHTISRSLFGPLEQFWTDGEPQIWHAMFWCAVVYFEETTVYMHARLAHHPEVQPVWAAAHRAHMREEVQHLLTDMAHVEAIGLSGRVHRVVSDALLFTIGQTLDVSFGSRVAARMVAAHFPDVAAAPIPNTGTAVYEHIVRSHPVFRRSRQILAQPTTEREPETSSGPSERGPRTNGHDAVLPKIPGLHRDAALGFEVKPIDTMPTNPAEVLVTGATGFVGAHLVAALLEHTPSRLHLLVRASDDHAARRRVDQALASYGLAPEGIDNRVSVWAGDVSRPGLGLAPARFDALVDAVGAIYHSAAILNFAFRYSDLAAVNVEGTRQLLRMASDAGAAMHHFSTIGVLLATGATGGVFDEDCVPDPATLGIGYAQSKWVAEQLVRNAADAGLAVTTYRIGQVIGHSETGMCRDDDDLMALLLKAATKLATYTAEEGAAHTLVPVDFVADAIVKLSREASARGRTFHLVGPFATLDLADFPPFFELGLRLVDSAQWVREFQTELGAIRPFAALAPVVPELLQARAQTRVDGRSTRAALRALGVEFPPLESTFAKYCEQLARCGVLDV